MAGRLSILHVAIAYGYRGGQAQVLALSRGLVERGHGCALLAPDDSELAARARAAGVPVEPVALLGRRSPRTLLPFRRILRAREPDVVHLHGSTHHHLGAYARWIARVPATVLTRRESKRIRSVLRYRRSAHRVVAVSRAVAGVLRACRYPAARIDVVPDGVDAARFDRPADPARFRAELGVAKDAPLLVTLSHLTRDKGIATMLDAFGRLRARRPDARLAIVGEGSEEARLKALARERGLLGAVAFTGQREDVPEILAAADLYVTASRAEGLGLAILEAMAAGRAVLATDAGGIGESVRDGVTGRLVPASDAAAWADAAEALLADPGGRARMGAEGARAVRERFTVAAMVEGNLAVYARCRERSQVR